MSKFFTEGDVKASVHGLRTNYKNDEKETKTMKQTWLIRPQVRTSLPSGENVEQLSLARALLLSLGPGVCQVLFIWLISPWLAERGLPAELGVLLGMVLLGIPLELGYLLYLGKKRNGSFSLRGIVLYTQQMPLWQYAALFLPFVVYGLGLQALYSPIATVLTKQVFGWMPASMLPQALDLGPLTAITLMTALLTIALNGIINPIVEELYFRGYLLPRLSRWGWFAPVINALLFTLFHFSQPYNYPFIFLLVLPEVMIVFWKRNIRFSMLCHCTGNTLFGVLMLTSLLSTR